MVKAWEVDWGLAGSSHFVQGWRAHFARHAAGSREAVQQRGIPWLARGSEWWCSQALVLLFAGCISDNGEGGAPASGGVPASAANATGPIKIWFSNNAAGGRLGQGDGRPPGTSDHPDEKVSGAGDPRRARPPRRSSAPRSRPATRLPDLQHLAGRGAPVRASRAARRRSTASPTAATYIDGAHRRRGPTSTARPTASYYQMPWKSNPVMIIYNKTLFAKAGLRPRQPAAEDLRTTSSATAKTLVARPACQAAIWPAPTSRVLPAVVRLLPAVHRRDRRQAARRRTASARSTADDGLAVAELLEARLYDAEAGPPTRRTRATPSPTATRPWRSSDRGRSPSTPTRSTGASCRCRPRTAWRPTRHPHLQRREERSAMYTACKNQGTAWDFLKFSTSEDSDGELLEADRPDADAHRPHRHVRRLLLGEPELRGLRRAGEAHRRGAERARTRSRPGRRSATSTPHVGDLRQEHSSTRRFQTAPTKIDDARSAAN